LNRGDLRPMAVNGFGEEFRYVFKYTASLQLGKEFQALLRGRPSE